MKILFHILLTKVLFSVLLFNIKKKKIKAIIRSLYLLDIVVRGREEYRIEIISERGIEIWSSNLKDFWNDHFLSKSTFTLLRRLFVRGSPIPESEFKWIIKAIKHGIARTRWTNFGSDLMEILYIMSSDYPTLLNDNMDYGLFRFILDCYQSMTGGPRFLSVHVIGVLLWERYSTAIHTDGLEYNCMINWRYALRSGYTDLQSDICRMLFRLNNSRGKAHSFNF